MKGSGGEADTDGAVGFVAAGDAQPFPAGFLYGFVDAVELEETRGERGGEKKRGRVPSRSARTSQPRHQAGRETP